MTEKCLKEGELLVVNAAIKQLTERLDKNDLRYEKTHVKIAQDISDLGKVYEVIHTLSVNVAVIAAETKGTKESVDDMKSDMRSLMHLPQETKGIKQTVNILEVEVGKIKDGPADDMRHYKRGLVMAIVVIIVGAFFAGKFF